MPRWGLCSCCSLGKTISGPEKLEMPQSERLVIAGCIVWVENIRELLLRLFEACCRIICQWRKALLLCGPRTIREHTQRCKSRLTDQHVLCFVICGAFLSCQLNYDILIILWLWGKIAPSVKSNRVYLISLLRLFVVSSRRWKIFLSPRPRTYAVSSCPAKRIEYRLYRETMRKRWETWNAWLHPGVENQLRPLPCPCRTLELWSVSWMTGNALVPKSSVFLSLRREVLWHVDITWYMKFDKLWCLPWWTQKQKAAAVLGNVGGRLRGRASQHDISVTSYAIATQLLWNHTEAFTAATAATAAFILAGGCCARIWSWKPPACLRVHQVSCLERYTDCSFCCSEELPWNVQVQVHSRASLGVQFEWTCRTGTASMRRRFLNCLSSRTVFREDLAVESQLQCVCRPPLKDIDPEFFPGLRAKPWCLEPDLWKSLLSPFDGSCHFIFFSSIFFNILAFVASGLR